MTIFLGVLLGLAVGVAMTATAVRFYLGPELERRVKQALATSDAEADEMAAQALAKMVGPVTERVAVLEQRSLVLEGAVLRRATR